MQYIKIFTGILLVICLISNINFKALQKYLDERMAIRQQIEASSPLGLLVKDYKGRVKIIDVLNYTPAMNAGLEPGDRILKVNGNNVKNVASFFEIMESVNLDKPIKFLVYRVDSCSTFPVEIKAFECGCNKN